MTSSISLCMIVKDEEAHLARCLKQGDKIFFVERGDQYSIHSIVPSTSVVGKVQQIKKNEHKWLMERFCKMLLIRTCQKKP